MSLLDKVESLFRKHRLDLIDFSVGDLWVNLTNMKKVADAIKKGTVGVEVGNTGPLLAEAYSRKRLLLRKETEADYPEGRAAIVHEGVHAWADMASFKSGLLDECAAYLTEVIYLEHLKRRIPGHPISDAAAALAATHKLYGKRGKHLTRSDCQALSDAILAEPAYQGLNMSHVAIGTATRSPVRRHATISPPRRYGICDGLIRDKSH